jgi:hypothetical protein
MLGWFYIVLRNYPFWAIPLGLTILIDVLFGHRKKSTAKMKAVYMFLGILFIASSVFFLIYDGHKMAVPFMHEVFTHDRAN